MSYKYLSDMDDLRYSFECATQKLIDMLRKTIQQNTSNDLMVNVKPIDFSFVWTRKNIEYPKIELASSSILLAIIMPFSNLSNFMCEFQLPPSRSSQPDDPFDDLYMTFTTRERRKKSLGQSLQANDQNSVDVNNQPEMDSELTDQVWSCIRFTLLCALR